MGLMPKKKSDIKNFKYSKVREDLFDMLMELGSLEDAKRRAKEYMMNMYQRKYMHRLLWFQLRECLS